MVRPPEQEGQKLHHRRVQLWNVAHVLQKKVVYALV